MKNSNNLPHIPVLLNETINAFKEIKEGTFIDCTLGYAGHSSEILKHYPHINLIGIDRDDEALQFSRKRLEPFKDRIELKKGSFSEVLQEIDFSKVTGLLADFGVSSLQLDKLERGFSFQSQTLDMRMDQNSPFSAKELVNSYSLEKLTEIFRNFGEIKESRKLAQAIITQREKKPIESSLELSELISSVIRKKGKTHPATQAFQAIRIEVNKELYEIETLLDILEQKKPKNAIISLITFHSLEDRIVKQRFKKWAKKCICPPGIMRCMCGGDNNLGEELSKKPISASKKELEENPRSRSAKLRVFQFKG